MKIWIIQNKTGKKKKKHSYFILSTGGWDLTEYIVLYWKKLLHISYKLWKTSFYVQKWEYMWIYEYCIIYLGTCDDLLAYHKYS